MHTHRLWAILFIPQRFFNQLYMKIEKHETTLSV